MKQHILLALLCTSYLYADNTDIDNLFDLSLDELMNVEVTTASQEKEKASESLAVVSVLTSTQLKQMGALNLYEALSFLPGIQINETYMGYSVLTFRGVTPGLYNTKALFMVNGHPVHEKLFGSSHFEFVPLDMVERVEVVRSPSSVLYGTNAISGVVNVITKEGVEFNNEVAIRAGSHDHYYGSVSVHDTHVSMGASYQRDNGYDYDGLQDELGQTIDKDYQNDLRNLFIDIHAEQWHLQGSYYRSQKEKFGLNPIIQHGGINDYEAFYLDANKAITIGSGTLNLWLRYDYMDRELHTQRFPNPSTSNPTNVENTVERYSGEIQYKDTLFDDLHYILGLNYEYDKSDPMLFIDQTNGSTHPFSPYQSKETTNNLAVYTEVKYRFNDKLVGIAGFRLEDNSDTDTAFNPRLGLNYEYASDNYIKLLYSEAFRSPGFSEKYTNVPGILIGDSNLDREKIYTYELGLESRLNKRNSLQATLFYLELEDEITRRPANAGGTEYYNGDGFENYGLELAWESILNERTEFMFNASYVDGEYNENSEDINFVAHYTANLMLTYHLDEAWSSSFSNEYISSKDYELSDGSKGSIDHYNLSNITLTYLNKPFEANLYLKNIFDESYTQPEPVRSNLKEIPGGPGATAYLTLRYYF